MTTTETTTATQYQEERAELSFQQGSSDKVYHCQLTQAETGWSVTVQYGRRNSTLTSDAKIERVPYDQAKKVFDRTVREKVSRGYQHQQRHETVGEIVDRVQPAPLTNSRGAASKEIVFQPELLTRITELEAQRAASDPRYLFQTKQDGDRLAIHVTPGADDYLNIFGYNKLGQRVALDRTLHAAVAGLCEAANIESLLIDGEWESTGYYAWDILELSIGGIPGDIRDAPYLNRFGILRSVFQHVESELAAMLHLTNTADSTEEKLALLANRKLEGVCVKDRTAPFRPGRNGQHKKFKFEQTASFIVGKKPKAKANDGHRSVALYILDPAAKFHSDWQPTASAMPVRFVSTVKVPEKYRMPDLGSIVEVRYLYAYPAGGIAQPCYFGKVRDDVRHSDCTTAQLKFKAEEGDAE
jgi:ATP-dependent DNA ligase